MPQMSTSSPGRDARARDEHPPGGERRQRERRRRLRDSRRRGMARTFSCRHDDQVGQRARPVLAEDGEREAERVVARQAVFARAVS